MMRFCRNAARGYMKAVELVNDCWRLLFGFYTYWSCKDVLRVSVMDVLFAFVLFVALILITPLVYLCVAPFVALLKGIKGEGE